MVPFMKTSADKHAQTAKALAAEAHKMQHFAPVNDDGSTQVHARETEAKVANK